MAVGGTAGGHPTQDGDLQAAGREGCLPHKEGRGLQGGGEGPLTFRNFTMVPFGSKTERTERGEPGEGHGLLYPARRCTQGLGRSC